MGITNIQVQELYAELQGIAEQRKQIAEREAYIKARLAAAVKPGQTRAGVTHMIRTGKSVSWSKVANEIIDRLVPKTKWQEATGIVDYHTKETEAHIFKLANGGT